MVNHDYVEVIGEWNKETNGLVVEQFKKLNESEIKKYLERSYLILKIEVINYNPIFLFKTELITVNLEELSCLKK